MNPLLKETRVLCGVKSADIAEHLGLQRSNYCNMENGRLFTSRTKELEYKAWVYLKPILEQKMADTIERIEQSQKLLSEFSWCLSNIPPCQ
jgi:DNA-binding XRE family transcriptional regulator